MDRRVTLAFVMFVLPAVIALAWLAARQPHLDAPPGLVAEDRRFDSALAQSLYQLIAPTTSRHLTEEGQPRFRNRLLIAASPYLRAHGHDPVNWFPWGADAQAIAAELGVPMFVSIGYATCHWCHVMQHESFDDLEVAALLNQGFVAVKVDREELPEVDAAYQLALAVSGGRGGWPLTAVVLPTGEPIWLDTYLPPRDGDRGRERGLLTALQQISAEWSSGRAGVSSSASALAAKIREMQDHRPPPGALDGVDDGLLLIAAQAVYDPDRGGRKGAPKFLSDLPLRELQRIAVRDGNADAEAIVAGTLAGMARGGLLDPLGGVHRYAVDERWGVPHFEKMLYDQISLVELLLDRVESGAMGDEDLLAVDLLDFVVRELTLPDGTFASALDADSMLDGHLVEGAFYTVTEAEKASLVGLVSTGVAEGRQVVGFGGWPSAAVRAQAAPSLQALQGLRAERPRPLRDDKALVGLNGRTIAALYRAAVVLGRPDYAAAAGRAWATLAGAPLPHHLTGGVATGTPTSEDLAAWLLASLARFSYDGDGAALTRAQGAAEALLTGFEDPAGGFVLRRDVGGWWGQERPYRDAAEGSPNALAVEALLRLHALDGDDRWRASAHRALTAFGGRLKDKPLATSQLRRALSFERLVPWTVVLAIPAGADPHGWDPTLGRSRLRASVVVRRPDDAPALLPLLEGKTSQDGVITAYVCEMGRCEAPVTDPQALAEILRR